MKKLTTNQWIAVGISMAVVAALFFGGSFIGLFTQANQTDTMATTTPQTSGVQVDDVTIGKGAAAGTGDTVTVNYVGTLTDGKVFDSSIDRHQPFTFTLGVGQVIQGWDEGLVGMRVGGERKLTISPDYGYGAQAIGPIPPNSTLIFDVQMLSISAAPAATSTAR